MIYEGYLKIISVIHRAPGVKSFRLELVPGSSYTAGQFMCVRLEAGKEPKRWLSFSSSPTEKGYIEFTKRITQSSFSAALEKIKEGDRLYVQYPYGKFTLQAAGKNKIAFISGGIGITPIRSMCKYAVDTHADINIDLLYANRSLRDIVFKSDFDDMMAAFAGLRVEHVLCEAELGFKCTVGLINAGIVRRAIPDYPQRVFYLCGPPAMVNAMQQMLSIELGVLPGNIITENFSGY